ncbi:signal recognition particle receptor subunit alpha [Ditylenchus destructor]|nr:signal recognition particle receptor subunit alpha [Ditylenchus destructor]
MIELFTTFCKAGLVLWCFSEGSQYFKKAVNELISTVLLQECNVTYFNREGATIKYKLDNEFEIIVLDDTLLELTKRFVVRGQSTKDHFFQI